jgi:hypothetical protein
MLACLLSTVLRDTARQAASTNIAGGQVADGSSLGTDATKVRV